MSRLLKLLNQRRRALGLVEVKQHPDLVRDANSCARKNIDQGTLEHCGHEVLIAANAGYTPEQMIELWFNSPGHKTALTYASSRNAGAAIVTNDQGRLVAAINIDY